MYQSDEKIIEQLGIANLPADEQQRMIEEVQVRIGELVSENLTEQQLNEYQAIIDDDKEVIDAWLDLNVPDYKNSAAYQAFEEDYKDDPEFNNPAKLFASLAWIEFNVPNLEEVMQQGIDTYKQELSQAS